MVSHRRHPGGASPLGDSKRPCQSTQHGGLHDQPAHRSLVDHRVGAEAGQAFVDGKVDGGQVLQRRQPGQARPVQRFFKGFDRQMADGVEEPGGVIPCPGTIGVEPQPNARRDVEPSQDCRLVGRSLAPHLHLDDSVAGSDSRGKSRRLGHRIDRHPHRRTGIEQAAQRLASMAGQGVEQGAFHRPPDRRGIRQTAQRILQPKTGHCL